MFEFIITLLFGWLGVHKFIQKKYGLGILYFFTLGLCGIGWLIDTITAFMRMTNGKQETPEMQKTNVFSGERVRASDNNLIKGDLGTGNQTKKFTQPQLDGMKKADILELAAGLGYTMTTIESNTKDKIIADFMTQQENQANISSGAIARKWLIKSFNTEIVGTFADCDLNVRRTRATVITSLTPKSKLYLQYWEYKGEPAYYVCCQGIDAGNIPATLAKTLHEVYADCEFVVTLRDRAYLVGEDWMQKIKINIYK